MRYLNFIPVLLLFSCSSADSDSKTDHISRSETDTTRIGDSPDDTAQNGLPPIDPNKVYEAKILQVSEYHADEIMDNIRDLSWLAILRDEKGNCSLDKVDVITRRVEDPILDNEGEMTGWSIKANVDDEVVLLISGIDFLLPGKISEIKLDEVLIYPGDVKSYSFEGAEYIFTAKGKKTGDQYYTAVENYELYLTYKKDGVEKKQLITKVDYFDDALTQLLFFGDIDGDDIPDLIIDNSWHYNVSLPTLFLSRPATGDHFLKKVAEHESVGC